MAKKKKTREQKIIAEIRRREQLSAAKVYTLTDDIPAVSNEKKSTEKIYQPPTQYTAAVVNQHSYLIHDLKKTVFLTSAIIILQLILYFTVKL